MTKSQRGETLTITKIFDLAVDYVSCMHCAANYSCQTMLDTGKVNPVWCQVYSFRVDKDETEKNMEKASGCDSYVPRGMDRSKVKTPDIERWYEKESIA